MGFPHLGVVDQGYANSGLRQLQLWVTKILNIGLHNYFGVITFFASVFCIYFFELFGFETFLTLQYKINIFES